MSPQASMPAIQLWRGISQTPEIVNFFAGIFNKMAFTVAETGESFTATHLGNRIALSEGVDASADFLVPLHRENVERLAAETRGGRIPADEAWRIAAVLFTPLTQSTLRNPILSVKWLRVVAGVEDLIHVHLIRPDGGEAATHTLIYAAGQWVVLSGLHGKPRRTYRLTAEQSLDYQRHVFRAIEQNSMAGWWGFARWYRAWRRAVSVEN